MPCRILICLFLVLCIFSPALSADKGIDARAKGGTREATGASSPRRLALVIGNSSYLFSGALANPARDAELMAETLKGVGFELYGGGAQINLSRATLDQAIEGFGEQIRAGDVALFYYSGHGMQVNGENYLVPVDADLKSEAEVRVKTVPVNLLFAKLEGVPGAVNLVILDACRNNPFARSFRSSSGGLASVNAPTGTLVAFSTSPGQVAEDGSGNNSTYTAALARTITEPDLQIEEVFKQVRFTVTSTTKGRQTPWENTSLTGNFRFIEGDALALKKAALASAGAAKKGELDTLLRMEAEAESQKAKEKAEIAKREAEVARMDAEIVAMKSRLGAGTATGNDNLQNMLAMVEQKEAQAQKLEALRKQREAEEAKRRQEIARLKAEQQQKRQAEVDKDIAAYQKIVNSPYGREMGDAAWQGLVGKYAQTAEIEKGDVSTFRQVVIEGIPLTVIRERVREQEREQEQERVRVQVRERMVGKMVPVPGGCFRMGIDDGQWAEKPEHEVCVSGFQIGQTEVTQGQWRQVMGNNPSSFSSCGDTCPVENVSWNDIQDYLRKLNQQTGQNFRLPTEAEWEYAARSGGKQETYSGGDDIDAVAWHSKFRWSKTHPVGQKQANGLGLYDMSGNVWEWCQDWYGNYPDTMQKNPRGPSTGSKRVYRGGSWYTVESNVRVSFRNFAGPGNRDNDLGFRLALPSGQ